jgi:hypothetical protein
MMFLLDLAFAIEFIAFGVGMAFLVWAYRNDGVGIALAKVAGYIITIAAVIGISCTSYYGMKYWSKGYFSSPIPTHVIMKKYM